MMDGANPRPDPRQCRRWISVESLHQAAPGSPDPLLRDHLPPRLAELRKGNFKAIFESLEIEQERRGNL
jgi:hypothetical protein